MLNIDYNEIWPGTGEVRLNIGGNYVFVGWFHRNDPSTATNYPNAEYWALEPGTVLNNSQSNQQVRLVKLVSWGDDVSESTFRSTVCALSGSSSEWDIHVHSVAVTDPA